MKKSTAVLLGMLASAAAVADTLHVPGDYPSVQAAINAAVDGDTVLVAGGSWPGPINFLGKAIVVKSSSGPAATMIYTNWDYSAVYFQNGEDTTSIIEGFTLTNDVFEGVRPEGPREPRANGGGVLCSGASPTIRGNIIENCYVTSGGGIMCSWSHAIIEGNTIQGCDAANSGGGIRLGSQTPPGCRVVGNTIQQNEAYDGGGIRVWDQSGSGEVQILGNVITGNISDGSGGGIYFSSSSGTIAGNLIEGNESENNYGGGLFLNNLTATVQNNVISSNLAEWGGGGCTIGDDSGVLFLNNTVADNHVGPLAASGGGGIGSGCDSLLIANCIVWGNESPDGSQIYVGWGETEVEYTNVQFGAESIFVDPDATLIWGPGNIDEDPLFETGPLSDYHLSSGSPCIDAGNPDPAYNDPEDPMNPGYALWPALGGLRNDMGAYGGGGVGYWVGIEEEAEPPPVSEGLTLRVFPNPCRGSATLVFELDSPGQADLKVYDLSGRLVEELFSGDVPSGPMSCLLDGSHLPAGVYLVRLQTGDQSATVRQVKL